MGKRKKLRRSRLENKKPDRGGAEKTLGYWAVAFLDLMGYGALLDAFDVYPLPESGSPEAVALSAKAVRPWHFRRRLIDGTKNFMKGNAKAHPDLQNFPPTFQRLAETWRATRIEVQPLGDAVTMEVALKPDGKHFPARALDTMLTAACSASLLQLAIGASNVEDTLPLRGGIDIGAGAVFEGQLYSAALKKAVVLEDEAKFPRILVGDRLREYVESMASNDGNDLTSAYVRELMVGAGGFFFEDKTDGRWCLDFLGDHMHRRAPTAFGLVRDARTYVEKALLHHKGDAHLLEKYSWLHDYIKGRLPIWGIA